MLHNWLEVRIDRKLLPAGFTADAVLEISTIFRSAILRDAAYDELQQTSPEPGRTQARLEQVIESLPVGLF